MVALATLTSSKSIANVTIRNVRGVAYIDQILKIVICIKSGLYTWLKKLVVAKKC